ncbi:hypothetical protein K2173_006194 [Erythroxylum novogranatense]|uniref:DNA-directed RNA polymerase III subunit RPC5 n=1 Tax=Erythroxylum novogranatense TaxID=1862640 RepID=A0AAV8TDR7_9ROSI|nr:hypothetical protein K2173_006194 [Erythroxylum novogranatense]
MDLDDLDGPSQVPSRVTRFAPKSSRLKPQPQLQPKPEPKPSVPPPKTETGEQKIFNTREDEAKVVGKAKTETVASNGSVKLETEAAMSSNHDDAMEIDKDEKVIEEEEEDMIVREIDVFFTPSVDKNTQLYVMQYPLRPCWRPYDLDGRCQEVRVKPATVEVEVDLAIDDSTNWDSGIASKLDMTKQTLSTTWQPPRCTGYAVGVLIGNRLYLNPIHTVVQLRPSMDHLKPSDSKKKGNFISDGEAAVKVEDSGEGKAVSLSKKQNKHTESATEQKSDAECWIPLKFHSSKSEFSTRYLQRMVAQESCQIEFAMNPYDYMSSLCPGASDVTTKTKGPSRRFLLSLPLEERFKRLLSEGPPVQRFDALKHFAPDDTIQDVLAILTNHGRLVQGLWTPKSSLLFPNQHGMVTAARDYVLLLFSKNLIVDCSTLDVSTKFRGEMKKFLNSFAVEVSTKEWKFKEKPDTPFLKLYPEILKEQTKSWEETEKILNALKNSEKTGPGKKNVMTMPTVVHNQVRLLHPEKNIIKGTSGVFKKKSITGETREALLKALPKVFQNHKVCSFELICQGLRDLAIAQSTLPKADPRMTIAAASGADAPPEELKEVISEVATFVHGSYVLKSSSDHPEYDSLRKVVIDLLLARGPDAKIKKADILEAAKLALRRDVANNEYNKVMTDICVSKGSFWVLKSGDGKPC